MIVSNIRLHKGFTNWNSYHKRLKNGERTQADIELDSIPRKPFYKSKSFWSIAVIFSAFALLINGGINDDGLHDYIPVAYVPLVDIQQYDIYLVEYPIDDEASLLQSVFGEVQSIDQQIF